MQATVLVYLHSNSYSLTHEFICKDILPHQKKKKILVEAKQKTHV